MAAPKKSAETFEFVPFDFAKTNEMFRDMAEKGMAQSTEAYETFKAAAEDATATAQKSFDAMRAGGVEISAKAFENAKTNTEASLNFLEKLAGVKSVAEVFELQGEYFRNSFETLTAQVKEAQEMAVKVGENSAAPVQKATEKAVENVTNKAA